MTMEKDKAFYKEEIEGLMYYPEQPDLIPVFNDNYEYRRPWAYRINEYWIAIPAGEVIDGASVPQLAWSIMPPDGLWRAAAGAHDDMYKKKGLLRRYPNNFHFRIDRKFADQLFLKMMLESGVSKFRAYLAYSQVRIWGWTYWNT